MKRRANALECSLRYETNHIMIEWWYKLYGLFFFHARTKSPKRPKRLNIPRLGFAPGSGTRCGRCGPRKDNTYESVPSVKFTWEAQFCDRVQSIQSQTDDDSGFFKHTMRFRNCCASCAPLATNGWTFTHSWKLHSSMDCMHESVCQICN